MVEYEMSELSVVFRALGDATRRSLLTRLCQQGPQRVTDLARDHDMSLNAVSKHIKVLESASLVKRRTVGRTHMIEAQPTRIEIARVWLDQLRSIWDLRLDRLEALVIRGEDDDE